MNAYGEVIENANLKNYNTYKIETHAKYLLFPNDEEQLLNLLKYLELNNISYFIIGNGSNIILPDNDYDGVVINLKNFKEMRIINDLVEVSAGVMLPFFNQELLQNSYSNFYWASGIPGTIGGSLKGNAGAYGHDIMEYLEYLTVIKDNCIIDLKKEDIEYGYRFTNLNDVIIIKAVFKIIKGDIEEINQIIKENNEKRRLTQPVEYPTAGSVFRNPEGLSAGKLIEEAGLKGYKIGRAKVSEKHANFIINDGMATSSDIIDLIEYIKKEIKEKNNIDLVLEQIIVKWNDEES